MINLTAHKSILVFRTFLKLWLLHDLEISIFYVQPLLKKPSQLAEICKKTSSGSYNTFFKALVTTCNDLQHKKIANESSLGQQKREGLDEKTFF